MAGQPGNDPALSSAVHFLGPGQRNPSGTAAHELHHEFECIAAILPAKPSPVQIASQTGERPCMGHYSLLLVGATDCSRTARRAPRPVPLGTAWLSPPRPMDWKPTRTCVGYSIDCRTPRRSKTSRHCCRSAHSISHRNDGGKLALTLYTSFCSLHIGNANTSACALTQRPCLLR